MNSVKTLRSESVPSVFDAIQHPELEEEDFSSCRFCLKTFEEGEKEIAINQHIRKQFQLITQLELDRCALYSQNICEKCFDAARSSAKFRTQLIENQHKLEEEAMEKAINIEKQPVVLEEIKKEDEPLVDSIEFDQVNIIDEFKNVVDQDICEEYLDPELESLDQTQSIPNEETKSTRKTGRNKLCPGK